MKTLKARFQHPVLLSLLIFSGTSATWSQANFGPQLMKDIQQVDTLSANFNAL